MNLILKMLIPIVIKYLSKGIVIKSKVKTYDSHKHGSSYGEPVNVVLYWNVFRCDWTSSKEQVFEDYILNKMKPYIKNSIKKLKSYENRSSRYIY